MSNDYNSPISTSEVRAGGMSNTTKSIITILLIIFFFPAGLILMFVWKLWPVWVRVSVTCLVVLSQIVFWFILVPLVFVGWIFQSTSSTINTSLKESLTINAGVEFVVLDSYALQVVDFTDSIQTYCVIELQIANSTSENVDLSLTSFELYEVETGVTISNAFLISDIEDSITIPKLDSIDSVRADKTISGFIAYDCTPTNEYELEISTFSFLDTPKTVLDVSFETIKVGNNVPEQL